MALGTGLPEHELIALWVGDVFRAGRPRPRLLLSVFKGSGKASGTQEVLLSESLRGKLRRFWAWKVPPSAISAGWSASRPAACSTSARCCQSCRFEDGFAFRQTTRYAA